VLIIWPFELSELCRSDVQFRRYQVQKTIIYSSMVLVRLHGHQYLCRHAIYPLCYLWKRKWIHPPFLRSQSFLVNTTKILWSFLVKSLHFVCYQINHLLMLGSKKLLRWRKFCVICTIVKPAWESSPAWHNTRFYVHFFTNIKLQRTLPKYY